VLCYAVGASQKRGEGEMERRVEVRVNRIMEQYQSSSLQQEQDRPDSTGRTQGESNGNGLITPVRGGGENPTSVSGGSEY
jgi:hypothetical protein